VSRLIIENWSTFSGNPALAVSDFRQTPPWRQSGAARVLEELRRIAFADVRFFSDAAGNIKAVSQWNEEQSSAISRIETIRKNTAAGGGVVDRVLRIRYCDKLRALELLCKYFNLLTERLELNFSVDITLILLRRYARNRELQGDK
jgi:hypothetical protein